MILIKKKFSDFKRILSFLSFRAGDLATFVILALVFLIVLDIVLPNIDGFEVLKKLKEGETTMKIPVIIFSNLEDESDVNNGFQLGALDFLEKSNYQLKDVIQKIHQVLK